MRKEKIEELLKELGRRTIEPVRPGLCNEIKQQIPQRLLRHRLSWDTISIIIDLRMSRSTAAAAIIIAMILLLNVFGSRYSTENGIIRDSVMLLRYWRGQPEFDTSAGRMKYEYLLNRGEEVVWYGDKINETDQKDSNTILIQRKLPEGGYEITFIDGRQQKVNAEELVTLLSRMVQKTK